MNKIISTLTLILISNQFSIEAQLTGTHNGQCGLLGCNSGLRCINTRCVCELTKSFLAGTKQCVLPSVFIELNSALASNDIVKSTKILNDLIKINDWNLLDLMAAVKVHSNGAIFTSLLVSLDSNLFFSRIDLSNLITSLSASLDFHSNVKLNLLAELSNTLNQLKVEKLTPSDLVLITDILSLSNLAITPDLFVLSALRTLQLGTNTLSLKSSLTIILNKLNHTLLNTNSRISVLRLLNSVNFDLTNLPTTLELFISLNKITAINPILTSDLLSLILNGRRISQVEAQQLVKLIINLINLNKADPNLILTSLRNLNLPITLPVPNFIIIFSNFHQILSSKSLNSNILSTVFAHLVFLNSNDLSNLTILRSTIDNLSAKLQPSILSLDLTRQVIQLLARINNCGCSTGEDLLNLNNLIIQLTSLSNPVQIIESLSKLDALRFLNLANTNNLLKNLLPIIQVSNNQLELVQCFVNSVNNLLGSNLFILKQADSSNILKIVNGVLNLLKLQNPLQVLNTLAQSNILSLLGPSLLGDGLLNLGNGLVGLNDPSSLLRSLLNTAQNLLIQKSQPSENLALLSRLAQVFKLKEPLSVFNALIDPSSLKTLSILTPSQLEGFFANLVIRLANISSPGPLVQYLLNTAQIIIERSNVPVDVSTLLNSLTGILSLKNPIILLDIIKSNSLLQSLSAINLASTVNSLVSSISLTQIQNPDELLNHLLNSLSQLLGDSLSNLNALDLSNLLSKSTGLLSSNDATSVIQNLLTSSTLLNNLVLNDKLSVLNYLISSLTSKSLSSQSIPQVISVVKSLIGNNLNNIASGDLIGIINGSLDIAQIAGSTNLLSVLGSSRVLPIVGSNNLPSVLKNLFNVLKGCGNPTGLLGSLDINLIKMIGDLKNWNQSNLNNLLQNVLYILNLDPVNSFQILDSLGSITKLPLLGQDLLPLQLNNLFNIIKLNRGSIIQLTVVKDTLNSLLNNLQIVDQNHLACIINNVFGVLKTDRPFDILNALTSSSSLLSNLGGNVLSGCLENIINVLNNQNLGDLNILLNNLLGSFRSLLGSNLSNPNLVSSVINKLREVLNSPDPNGLLEQFTRTVGSLLGDSKDLNLLTNVLDTVTGLLRLDLSNAQSLLNGLSSLRALTGENLDLFNGLIPTVTNLINLNGNKLPVINLVRALLNSGSSLANISSFLNNLLNFSNLPVLKSLGNIEGGVDLVNSLLCSQSLNILDLNNIIATILSTKTEATNPFELVNVFSGVMLGNTANLNGILNIVPELVSEKCTGLLSNLLCDVNNLVGSFINSLLGKNAILGSLVPSNIQSLLNEVNRLAKVTTNNIVNSILNGKCDGSIIKCNSKLGLFCSSGLCKCPSGFNWNVNTKICQK